MFSTALHTGSRDATPKVGSSADRSRTNMEGQEQEGDQKLNLSEGRQDALVHDMILVVKNAMTKVSAREQLWCDIINKSEKDIRRIVNEALNR